MNLAGTICLNEGSEIDCKNATYKIKFEKESESFNLTNNLQEEFQNKLQFFGKYTLLQLENLDRDDLSQ